METEEEMIVGLKLRPSWIETGQSLLPNANLILVVMIPGYDERTLPRSQSIYGSTPFVISSPLVNPLKSKGLFKTSDEQWIPTLRLQYSVSVIEKKYSSLLVFGFSGCTGRISSSSYLSGRNLTVGTRINNSLIY